MIHWLLTGRSKPDASNECAVGQNYCSESTDDKMDVNKSKNVLGIVSEKNKNWCDRQSIHFLQEKNGIFLT